MNEAGMIPLRVVELTARTVYEFDEKNNKWVVVENSPSVTDQFNELADNEELNPFGTPTITQTQIVEIPDQRVTVAFTLCACVIKRKEQFDLEVRLRRQALGVAQAVTEPVPTTKAPSAPSAPARANRFQLPLGAPKK